MSLFYRGAAPGGPGPLARPASVTRLFPHAEAQDADLRALNADLTLWQGTVILPGDFARIDVPPGQYFLDGPDTDRLNELVQGMVWDHTLGSLSPLSYPPAFSGGWNLDLSWLERGHVALDGPAPDPEALLAARHARIAAEAPMRAAEGEPEQRLLGWALPPRLDRARRVLTWATESLWADEDAPVLSLNLHWFGRSGHVSGIVIAGMDHLPEIEAALPAFLDMLHFAEGCRHEDFDPETDAVFEPGLAGLVGAQD
ncbi:DUF2167 domain-containing protein [Oceanicella sp. SM1341]|uniref:DUF2167 domain-containing protein n=1 Tax=Oceanicella sp. SM1341 TaxID=1548889 RepID=UPI001300B1C0|nr:DUF2167 domain-containing protein [Oceanicella sp. SM1341]